MHDMTFVRRADTLNDLDRDSDGFADLQLTLLLDILLQGNAFHKFHNDIVELALVTNIEDAYDIRMG